MYAKTTLIFLSCLVATSSLFGLTEGQKFLEQEFQKASLTVSDINEHILPLSGLAKECSSVVEIGVRSMVSTWGLLYGLQHNLSGIKSYLGIDLQLPPQVIFRKAKRIAHLKQISFDFWAVNDMDIDIPQTDLLFIDSLHTYCHLTYELEKFHSKVGKYIALHDTSPPWENVDDDSYHGDHSEYPSWIDRNKRGLWSAVEDFLVRHPEWTLALRKLNCHGFTVLKRI